MLSLAVTPASRLTGWGWLGQFRRMLGLYAFFHAALHFLLFFGLDRAANAGDTASEVLKRPYLMVGMVGLVLMVPLAATSTNGMIRRLGPARWKALHRLAYVAAAAGSLHFYMLVKADVKPPGRVRGRPGAALPLPPGRPLPATPVGRPEVPDRPARRSPPRVRSPGPGSCASPRYSTRRPRSARSGSPSPDGPRLPFDFLPGQYLNLTLAIDGRKVRRSYTIASPPTRVGYCEVTVKREDRGLSSRHLHDAVRAGDLLDVLAPAGRFTFTGAEAGGIVLIAGGVGITPLMSKVRYLTDLSWPGAIDLVFSVKTERDIIFRDELNALLRRHPNLRVTVTLTREDGAELVRGAGPDQRRDAGTGRPGDRRASGPHLRPDRDDRPCPSDAYRAGRARRLDPGGVVRVAQPRCRCRPGRACARQACRGGGRCLLRWGHDLVRPLEENRARARGQTVLEAAEALGVAINYDCRAGICGQCKIRLLSGRVVMDAEDALDPVDRANDLILSCQARCVDHVVVEA